MKVLLIDDHPIVNTGLSHILEETGRFSVSGKVNSLTQAKEFIALHEDDFPSLIIQDILLGNENGLDFLTFLDSFCEKKKIKKPPVLVYSVLEEPFRIQSALKLGASGYVTKTGNTEELLNAIEKVLQGQVYISSENSLKVMQSYSLFSKFTKRELDIFNLLKENKSNKEIAKILSLGIRTIENHVSNIYYITGTKSRNELMKM